ncbi:osmoprotectant NAGGN system M42 family peptidase, partial [Pseudomonas syringae pv. tagetis]
NAVSVAMDDSGGPYVYHLSRLLLRLGVEIELPVRRDLFRYYYCDAHSAVTSGHDSRTALLAFGCDAPHGYARTQIDC